VIDLICENGDRLRIAPHARAFSNQFSYQVLTAGEVYEGLLGDRGCVTVSDAEAMAKKGLLLTKATSVFENPDLCKSMFQWDPSHEIDFILKNQKENGRVLDVGCGWGRLLNGLLQHGAEVDGFDSSPALVDAARKHLPLTARLFVSSMSDFCSPSTYSVAFAAMNTIRYATSHGELISHLRAIENSLVPGGRYLIHTTLLDDPRTPSRTGWSFEHRGKKYHVQWKGHSIDFFRRVLYEEVTLTDLGTRARHRELQRQLLFSLQELIQYTERAGSMRLAGVFNEFGEEVSNVDSLNGRYWITFEKCRRT
jgi:SAM-dependent methyltransferase